MPIQSSPLQIQSGLMPIQSSPLQILGLMQVRSPQVQVRSLLMVARSCLVPESRMLLRVSATFERWLSRALRTSSWDSGADISALPDSYASVGEADGPPTQKFVDASGRLLKSKGMRVAEVQIGSLRFKERFLVGGVTCPLLSLGKLYKAGFYVVPASNSPDGFVLTNGNVREPVKTEAAVAVCIRKRVCAP